MGSSNTINDRYLEIVASGEITVTKPALSTVGFEILTHNLGYKPIALCFLTPTTLDGASVMHPFIQAPVAGATAGILDEFTRIYVSDTEVEFNYVTPNNGSSSSLYDVEVTAIFNYWLLKQVVV